MLVKTQLLADSLTLRRPYTLTAGERRSLNGNRTLKGTKVRNLGQLTHPPSAPAR